MSFREPVRRGAGVGEENIAMANDAGREKGIEKLRELIEGVEYVMLTTVATDGSLHSRPMAAQNAEFDGTLWFFTRASSHKVEEVEKDHHVNVAYASADDKVWVSLSGRAALVRDRTKMEELWSPEMEAYFGAGLEDPDIALLKVSVQRGEYWEGPGPIAYAVEIATALVTGREANPGENEKVEVGA